MTESDVQNESNRVSNRFSTANELEFKFDSQNNAKKYEKRLNNE